MTPERSCAEKLPSSDPPGTFRVLGEAGQPDVLIYSFDEWLGENKTPAQPIVQESRWSLKRALGFA